jgi:hypothetical protein
MLCSFFLLGAKRFPGPLALIFVQREKRVSLLFSVPVLAFAFSRLRAQRSRRVFFIFTALHVSAGASCWDPDSSEPPDMMRLTVVWIWIQ